MAQGKSAPARGTGAPRRSGGDPAPDRSGERLSDDDRVARGRDARASTPLDSHAQYGPDRARDPVGLLLEQDRNRVPELVPVRTGRMLVSPFAYFRGAALPMAADLAGTPSSGL